MSKVRPFARWVLPAICLLIVRAPAQSMFAGSESGSPGFNVYAEETGGALVTGSVCAAGLCVGLVAAWSKPGDDVEDALMAWLFGGLAGIVVAYPIGCAAGATIVGGMSQQGGNFLLGYLGALAGLPVGYGIAAGGQAIPVNSAVLKGAFVVAGCLAPPVGATVGYNLIRNPVPGLGRLDQRLLMPSLGLRGEPAGKEAAVALDMKLLTVRF